MPRPATCSREAPESPHAHARLAGPCYPLIVASKIDSDDDVPRLPRGGGGFKLSPAALFRIVLTGALLAMIIVAQRPCANAVSGFVTSFDEQPGGSGAPQTQMPKPGTVVPPTESPRTDPCAVALRADMTEAEITAAVERAKLCAKERENTSPRMSEPAPAPDAGGAR